jgi:hypothetical protein
LTCPGVFAILDNDLNDKTKDGGNPPVKLSLKPNLFWPAALALTLCACGPDANQEPPGETDPGPEPPMPTSPAELAELRCGEVQPLFGTSFSDDFLGHLGSGYLLLGDPVSVDGEDTGVMCVHPTENRRIEPAVSLDARMFVVHNEHEGFAKMRANLDTEWSGLNWAETHADYFDDFFEDGAPYTNGTFGHATDQTDVLVLAAYVTTSTHTLEDLDVTYDADRLDFFVDACGSGFVEREWHGGGFMVMADISALSPDDQRQLEALVDEHAREGRLDTDAFAQAYRDAAFPPLSYWTPVMGGLGFRNLSLFGDDLEGVLVGLPQLEDTVEADVNESMANGQPESSAFGTTLGIEAKPYSDEQIASTQLDDAGRQGLTCYRDFAVRARALLQRANHYAAEAKCYRDIYGLYALEEEDVRRWEHYKEAFERLSDVYQEVRHAHERCYDSMIYSDDTRPELGEPCEECQVPEEFDEDALERAYDNLQP